MLLLIIVLLNLDDYISGNKILKKLREDPKVDWISGDNERFRGLTFKDAKVISGSAHKLRPDTIPLAPETKVNVSIPFSYNFTETHPECNFGPLDQGRCGSCWAFSVAKSFSHRYCKKYKALRVFSPTHLVGCDRRNSGCGGGITIPAWRYIDLRGLPLLSCQPYDVNQTEFKCSKKCVNSEQFVVNYTEFWSVVRFPSIQDMQIAIMKDGPVTTSIRIYSDLLYYKSGVYNHIKGDLLAFHAVEITGWGVLNGVDYWIISNSWGPDWGLLGSFLIKRGVNECGVEDYVCAGNVK